MVHTMRRKTVVVNDKMQRGYRYVRSAPPGRGFTARSRACDRA
jgi:hypothetical protein